MEDYAVVVAAACESFEVFAGLKDMLRGVLRWKRGWDEDEPWEHGHGRALLQLCPGNVLASCDGKYGDRSIPWWSLTRYWSSS